MNYIKYYLIEYKTMTLEAKKSSNTLVKPFENASDHLSDERHLCTASLLIQMVDCYMITISFVLLTQHMFHAL